MEQPGSMKDVVSNINSYISSDPGVLTYLQGPLYLHNGGRPPHWAVRSAAAIALLFKVGAIALALLAVVLLSYLGIMMSWGLAFGLPWTLAYFYFIWICPAHQLSMGIRKLKPYRMLWWVASTGLHCVLLVLVLTSYTTFSSNYLHVDHVSLVKPLVFLCLVLGILLVFEVLVIYAFFLVYVEKSRLDAETSQFSQQFSLSSEERTSSSPPPTYSEVVQEQTENEDPDGDDEHEENSEDHSQTSSQPPKYEDLFKNLQDSHQNEDASSH